MASDDEGGQGIGRLLGLGHDLVHIPTFSRQLALPGSRMRSLFSARELKQSAARAQLKGDSEALHLAARWAGKEAALKAWSAALGSQAAPYTIDNFPWSQVEILDDSRSRPGIYLAAEVDACLRDSLPLQGPPRWFISLTHEAEYASAVVVLGSRAEE